MRPLGTRSGAVVTQGDARRLLMSPVNEKGRQRMSAARRVKICLKLKCLLPVSQR